METPDHADQSRGLYSRLSKGECQCNATRVKSEESIKKFHNEERPFKDVSASQSTGGNFRAAANPAKPSPLPNPDEPVLPTQSTLNKGGLQRSNELHRSRDSQISSEGYSDVNQERPTSFPQNLPEKSDRIMKKLSHEPVSPNCFESNDEKFPEPQGSPRTGQDKLSESKKVDVRRKTELSTSSHLSLSHTASSPERTYYVSRSERKSTRRHWHPITSDKNPALTNLMSEEISAENTTTLMPEQLARFSSIERFRKRMSDNCSRGSSRRHNTESLDDA